MCDVWSKNRLFFPEIGSFSLAALSWGPLRGGKPLGGGEKASCALIHGLELVVVQCGTEVTLKFRLI